MAIDNKSTVRFIAGYGAVGSSVPEDLVNAILEIVADTYANRESFIAGSSIARVPEDAMQTLMSFTTDI